PEIQLNGSQQDSFTGPLLWRRRGMFRATEPAARAAGETGYAGRRVTAVGRRGAVLPAVPAVALAAAACSSPPSGGSGTASGPIVFADVAPFSGPDAALG